MPSTVWSGDKHIVEEGQAPPDNFTVFMGDGLVDLTRVKLKDTGDVHIRLDAVFGKVTLKVTDEQPVLFEGRFTNFAGRVMGKQKTAPFVPGQPAIRVRGSSAFGLLKVKVIPAPHKEELKVKTIPVDPVL
eukprot:CAMPEP_0184653178 /NCGR_PEP_ID=MMETSP0308-20130426/10923_1 /TAXON_ID=38269 /ORGANISM="Gloeochaete witrockiana, Strain SAG 46.84" /LENGTH=130 /DNA_ID=CAMNT_0027088519 /DNA_START=28 /DNA_END=420 /DNA_ORIENTATION=-